MWNRLGILVIGLLVLGACRSKKVISHDPADIPTKTPTESPNTGTAAAAFELSNLDFRTFSGKAKASLGVNEDSKDVNLNLHTYAWVLFQQQQYKEALIWIEKAIKLSKVPSAVLYEHYGDILSKNGKSAEAVKYWKLAIPNAQKEGINLEKLNQKINTKSYVE